jgi:hypothetical protein
VHNPQRGVGCGAPREGRGRNLRAQPREHP